jgi:hypothetical protein
MTGLRILLVGALAAVAACSAPSPQRNSGAAELNAVAPLKREYAGVVMGFDIPSPNTLIVSVDLQRYIGMDDDAVVAMQRHCLAVWKSAWEAAHPRAHGVVRLRFIDFIGRKVAELTSDVRGRPR